MLYDYIDLHLLRSVSTLSLCLYFMHSHSLTRSSIILALFYPHLSHLKLVHWTRSGIAHIRKITMCLKYTEISWNRLFQCFSIQTCTEKAYFSRFQYILALCTFSDAALGKLHRAEMYWNLLNIRKSTMLLECT